jgi:nucleoside-diphosphate-sugar epimerase
METVRENTGMASVVAQACGDLGLRLVLGSTDQVYGRTGAIRDELKGPWVAPPSLYALTKSWNEQVATLYAPKGLAILRYSMIYGPGLTAGPRRSALINMLWRASRGIPIPVHNGAERSWCWIQDAIRATRLVIEQGEGPFNIGRSDDLVTMEHVAHLACSVAEAPSELIEVIQGDASAKRISTRRISALGWEPQIDIEEGIGTTYSNWIVNLDETGRPAKEVKRKAKAAA